MAKKKRLPEWTPERQVRFARAVKADTLGWRCIICNLPLAPPTDCPHSYAEHQHVVNECRQVELIKKVMNSHG